MKTTRRNTLKIAGLAALLAGGSAVRAQAPPQATVVVREKIAAEGVGLGAGRAGTFEFVSNEMVFSGKVLKGAPYAADATTETTQVLADGNRIVHKNKSTTYRDSEGRTRNEQTLAAIGPWAASGNPPQLISILDPVAGVSYVLNVNDRTARKISLPQANEGAAAARSAATAKRVAEEAHLPGRVGGMMVTAVPPGAAGASGPNFFYRVNGPGNPPQTESLGTQTIEGLLAQGTRTTMTIPAGQIGNEQPIQIVSEQWYSPDLQTIVMSKRNDPQMGQTVYQLTNINRSEPPHSLFEVPADYTIKEEPAAMQKIQLRRSTEN